MFIVYDLIFLIFALVSLPGYLFKGRFHRGFGRRLGILPAGLKLERPVWVHAVSVGEALTVGGLLEELRKVFPGRKFVISTVTPTGNQIAARFAREGDLVTFLPFDLSFIVGRVLREINPALFVIAETEIWPNLICRLRSAAVPVVIVNGRISDSSFKGYLAVKFLLKPVLEKVSFFGVQSETDAARLLRLGVAKERIEVTGNMKFDAAGLKIDAAELINCRQSLGLRDADKLLVCGSTHRGEEEILLRIYSRLQQAFSGLKLLIAPRHPERAAEIARLAARDGFAPALLSRLDPQTPRPPHPRTIFILDNVGQLANFYAVADIVFVGGSLVKRGGHNILEPAFLERPILFGPHMSNFRDIAELFLRNNAALAAPGERELEAEIAGLLNNPRRCAELGAGARRLILDNQGATLRNVRNLRQVMV